MEKKELKKELDEIIKKIKNLEGQREALQKQLILVSEELLRLSGEGRFIERIVKGKEDGN